MLKTKAPFNADFRLTRNRRASPPRRTANPVHPHTWTKCCGSACASHQVSASYDGRYSSIIRRPLRPAGRVVLTQGPGWVTGRRYPAETTLPGVACFHSGRPCVGTPSSFSARLRRSSLGQQRYCRVWKCVRPGDAVGAFSHLNQCDVIGTLQKVNLSIKPNTATKSLTSSRFMLRYVTSGVARNFHVGAIGQRVRGRKSPQWGPEAKPR